MKSQPSNMRTAERSQETQPCYLYVLQVGSVYVQFTNYDQDVTVSGGSAPRFPNNPQTFTASQIAHTKPRESVELNPNTVNVTLPARTEDLRDFFFVPSTKKIFIWIYRVNSGNLPGPVDFTDLYLEFAGRGAVSGFSELSLMAGFKSLVIQQDGEIPGKVYQKTCGHHLYDVYCGVNRSLYTLSTTITAINRIDKTITIAQTTVNVDSPSRTLTIDAETFEGGIVTDADDNEIGIIVCEVLPAAAGTKLWLNYWTPELAVSAAIDVALGCKHIPRACHTTFRNKDNYLGQPFIPTSNPAIHGLRT